MLGQLKIAYPQRDLDELRALVIDAQRGRARELETPGGPPPRVSLWYEPSSSPVWTERAEKLRELAGVEPISVDELLARGAATFGKRNRAIQALAVAEARELLFFDRAAVRWQREPVEEHGAAAFDGGIRKASEASRVRAGDASGVRVPAAPPEEKRCATTRRPAPHHPWRPRAPMNQASSSSSPAKPAAPPNGASGSTAHASAPGVGTAPEPGAAARKRVVDETVRKVARQRLRGDKPPAPGAPAVPSVPNPIGYSSDSGEKVPMEKVLRLQDAAREVLGSGKSFQLEGDGLYLEVVAAPAKPAPASPSSLEQSLERVLEPALEGVVRRVLGRVLGRLVSESVGG
jgi:hypothetical protein